MKPYVICHMLSSIDGKIDGGVLDAVVGEDEYDATGARLEGDAWICGRTTMQQHFAEDAPFVSASNTPAAGESSIDLAQAVNKLGEHFGIRTLLLEGGGHINGAFLQADLVDEVSLLLAPGIDGRHDIPAVFDGVNPLRSTAVPLKLKLVEQRANDTLWIRYTVDRA
jgi:riboflavin biosynthesis pyrimidine reductase